MFQRCVPLLAILLVACASKVPYTRPDLPVPDQWAGGLTPVVGTQVAPLDWKHYFRDARLTNLIGRALQNNRDLRIATARVLEARAQYNVVAADRLPSLGLNASSSVVSVPGDLASTTTTQRFDLGVASIGYELDFWGRVASLTEAARNTYLASEEARRSFQASLVADVASTYFTLLQFDELARLAGRNVESRESSLELIRAGRNIGGADDWELVQATNVLESSRATLDSVRHQRRITLNRLSFLVGEPVSDLSGGVGLSDQALDLSLTPGLPSAVLLRRPDIMAAEQRLQATNANVEAARAAFLPRIALTAGIGLASQSLLGLFSSGAWSFQPVLTLPLFDNGKTQGGLDLAQARQQIGVAEYEKTIQAAFREVSDLLSARASLERQMRAAAIAEQAQGRRLEIAQARHQIGLAGYLDVLEAQRDLSGAQQNMVQVRRAQLETTVQLYKALGGGA